MSDEIQTFEELAFGPDKRAILAAREEMVRKIPEARFKREIIPILRDPFSLNNQRHYMRYVEEIFDPLDVVDESGNVLFRIPGLAASTIPASSGNGPTTMQLMAGLARQYELGNNANGELTLKVMEAITNIPDLTETILKPIAKILVRYNDDFYIDQGDGTFLTLRGVVKAGEDKASPQAQSASAGTNSYTDDYDD